MVVGPLTRKDLCEQAQHLKQLIVDQFILITYKASRIISISVQAAILRSQPVGGFAAKSGTQWDGLISQKSTRCKRLIRAIGKRIMAYAI